jgi:hypothetical protein
LQPEQELLRTHSVPGGKWCALNPDENSWAQSKLAERAELTTDNLAGSRQHVPLVAELHLAELASRSSHSTGCLTISGTLRPLADFARTF